MPSSHPPCQAFPCTRLHARGLQRVQQQVEQRLPALPGKQLKLVQQEHHHLAVLAQRLQAGEAQAQGECRRELRAQAQGNMHRTQGT